MTVGFLGSPAHRHGGQVNSIRTYCATLGLPDLRLVVLPKYTKASLASLIGDDTDVVLATTSVFFYKGPTLFTTVSQWVAVGVYFHLIDLGINTRLPSTAARVHALAAANVYMKDVSAKLWHQSKNRHEGGCQLAMMPKIAIQRLRRSSDLRLTAPYIVFMRDKLHWSWTDISRYMFKWKVPHPLGISWDRLRGIQRMYRVGKAMETEENNKQVEEIV